PGHARDERRAAPRPQRPGAAARRRRHRRSLRRGQHRRQRVRLGVPERWRHPRQRHRVRLPRRAARRLPAGARHLTSRPAMSSGTDRRARRDANEHGANEQAASEHGASEQRHRSFCRFCSALCGIIVTTRGDEVVDVRGDPEHPLSRGYTCPKGRALGAWHHHSLRLDAPLLGRGDARRPTDWGSCLDDLAARIRAVQDAHGPDAVGMYLATASSFDAAGGRLAFRLFQALGSRSRYTAVTIDTPCRPLVSDLMSGQAGLMPCLDLDTAGLTILVGTNPVVSHGHTTSMPDPVVRLRELASAPRELWVIDPRRTETARIATRHLAPRPGTD